MQKFPAINFSDPRLKYRNRKDITLSQGEMFMARMKQARYVSLESWMGFKQIVYKNERTNPNVTMEAQTALGLFTNGWSLQEGRGFSEQEVHSGQYLCILGTMVAEKLFPYGSPLGEEVKIDGNKFRIIGVTESRGGIFGGDQDNFVIVPLNTALAIYGKRRSVNILVQAYDRESYNETMELSRMVLHTIRRVPPGSPDDFEIFSNEMLIQQFNEFTFLVKIGAMGLACIALIAAGVGIMNIMLVSVMERIKEIGIRKALGATKSNILMQFLTESIVFSQIGGFLGIAAGTLLGNLVCFLVKAPPIMPWNNTLAVLKTPFLSFTPLEVNIVAFLFCSLIGMVFGVYPAWKAANLNPIDSLRYE
jgi:putative ABC transport system permease protein